MWVSGDWPKVRSKGDSTDETSYARTHARTHAVAHVLTPLLVTRAQPIGARTRALAAEHNGRGWYALNGDTDGTRRGGRGSIHAPTLRGRAVEGCPLFLALVAGVGCARAYLLARVHGLLVHARVPAGPQRHVDGCRVERPAEGLCAWARAWARCPLRACPRVLRAFHSSSARLGSGS